MFALLLLRTGNSCRLAAALLLVLELVSGPVLVNAADEVTRRHPHIGTFAQRERFPAPRFADQNALFSQTGVRLTLTTSSTTALRQLVPNALGQLPRSNTPTLGRRHVSLLASQLGQSELPADRTTRGLRATVVMPDLGRLTVTLHKVHREVCVVKPIATGAAVMGQYPLTLAETHRVTNRRPTAAH